MFIKWISLMIVTITVESKWMRLEKKDGKLLA